VKSVRIVSYNVRYFGHSTRGLASTRTSMRKIAAAIAGLKPLPAIVCLQEVETRSIRSTVADPGSEQTQLERFMGMLSQALVEAGAPDAYDAYYFPAHAYRIAANTHAYTTGLAVLAHSDLAVDHHNAEMPHDITHRRLHAVRKMKQTRICAHVRFRFRDTRDGQRPIDVFNTHLSLPSYLAKEFWTQPKRLGWGRNQVEEVRNLAKFVERERGSDRFIVLGDFNALPGSPAYQYLVEEAGWADAFAQRYRFSVADLATWPTAGFMRMRMHLDHLFTGTGLRWLNFDETRPFGDRESPFHGLSDHVPMVAACRPSRADTIPPR
jgi:endonuclease/exonuclease/phosphatase family metal-dependent hydrolase